MTEPNGDAIDIAELDQKELHEFAARMDAIAPATVVVEPVGGPIPVEPPKEPQP